MGKLDNLLVAILDTYRIVADLSEVSSISYESQVTHSTYIEINSSRVVGTSMEQHNRLLRETLYIKTKQKAWVST